MPVRVEERGDVARRSCLERGLQQIAGVLFETAVDEQNAVGSARRDDVRSRSRDE